MIAIGRHVRVINGLSKGASGEVVGLSRATFDGETVWLVRLPWPTHDRPIRASYLTPIDTPN